jgi:hypothetical protein
MAYSPAIMLPNFLAPVITHKWASTLILLRITKEGESLLLKTQALRSLQIS